MAALAWRFASFAFFCSRHHARAAAPAAALPPARNDDSKEFRDGAVQQ